MSAAGYTPIKLYASTTASAVPLAANLDNTNGAELAINTNDGKLYYKDSSGVVQLLAAKGGNGVTSVTGTAPIVSSGGATPAISLANTAVTPGSYTSTNLTVDAQGRITAATSGVGGATLSNDTSTATNLYPLFAAATSGVATTVYTSNAKYLYKPSTGELQASEVVASNGIYVNSQTISTSYTIPTGSSAMSSGPITVASGQTVTVSSGSRWVIL